MLVLGTQPKYFDAIWVKNEWSRFAELIDNGEQKVLIPILKIWKPVNYQINSQNIRLLIWLTSVFFKH